MGGAATLSGFGGGSSWKEFESARWPALTMRLVVVLKSTVST